MSNELTASDTFMFAADEAPSQGVHAEKLNSYETTTPALAPEASQISPYKPVVRPIKDAKIFNKAFKRDTKDLPEDLSQQVRAERVAFRKHVRTQLAGAGLSLLELLSPVPTTARALLITRLISTPVPADLKPDAANTFSFREPIAPNNKPVQGSAPTIYVIPGRQRGFRSNEAPKKLGSFAEGPPPENWADRVEAMQTELPHKRG